MKRAGSFLMVLALLTGTLMAGAAAAEAQGDPCADARNGNAPAGYEIVWGNGGSGSQVVLGTDGDDDLSGGSGDDILCGFGGDDVLRGGSGDDWLDAGTGTNALHGGSGADTLIGTDGNGAAAVAGWFVPNDSNLQVRVEISPGGYVSNWFRPSCA